MICRHNYHGRSSILSNKTSSLICLKQGVVHVGQLAGAKESKAIEPMVAVQ